MVGVMLLDHFRDPSVGPRP